MVGAGGGGSDDDAHDAGVGGNSTYFDLMYATGGAGAPVSGQGGGGGTASINGEANAYGSAFSGGSGSGIPFISGSGHRS